MTAIEPPMAMLAEITHRCPLQCPYCSNPIALERSSKEMGTEDWRRAIREAADLGCMQVHFSGGEPTVRQDLELLIAEATAAGLYTNLITSGVLLDELRLKRLVEAGLEHVQLSFQAAEARDADRIGGFGGSQAKKLEAAALVRAAGLPLTANFVVHRQNIAQIEAMLDLAVTIGAHRVEIANVQYYGWALKNRAALMPSREQLDLMTEQVTAARDRLKGVTVIDYVIPDYYARRPKACMGGWGQRFLNVSPTGNVLPCHAAESITGLEFDNVRQRSLADIWNNSKAFSLYRGTDWMPEPCRSCDRREVDWGGCRCQAFAITGDAARTDPACEFSEDHGRLVDLAEQDSGEGRDDFVYRNFAAARRAPVEAGPQFALGKAGRASARP